MTLTFTKKRKATQSYGRGMDNNHTPAQYWIELDGERIGYISSSPRSYMGSAAWDASVFIDGTPRPVGTPTCSTLRELKTRLQDRHEDGRLAKVLNG